MAKQLPLADSSNPLELFMKKHIYIAYTGGTIGMRPSSKGYVPVPGFLADTLANMPEA